MGRRASKVVEEEEVPVDPSEWILANAVADFILMNSAEVKYMVMVGYTFLHGKMRYIATLEIL
jgi:hypothetical protein